MKISRKRDLLPLLAVLKSIPSKKRIVLLPYLNDQTHDALCELIIDVNNSKRIPFALRHDLSKKLHSHKKIIDYVIQKKVKSPSDKVKKLVHLGGSPMHHILQLAVPYLFNIFP